MKYTIYSSKKQSIKIGMFAKLDFVPNKPCFVNRIDKDNIYFLVFMKEDGSEFKAIEHSINKACKKDFDIFPTCYEPIQSIIELIENFNK